MADLEMRYLLLENIVGAYIVENFFGLKKHF